MIGADQKTDEMRDDDADEADWATERHRRAGRERGAQEGEPLRAVHVDTAAGGTLIADR